MKNRTIRHQCNTHEEWLQNVHYMCSCGHVEWAHHGVDRFNKGPCSHCNCANYKGEVRPLTDYELAQLQREQADGRIDREGSAEYHIGFTKTAK